MNIENLTNKNILVISHIFTTVPAEDLKKFLLKQNINYFLYITHPLFFHKDRVGSTFLLYKKGKLIKKIVHKNNNIPSIILYIKDIFLTIYWIMKSKIKWDIAIALDNLNTLSCIFIKKIYIKKLVYYTIDFVPKRFNNKILNKIYHFIDKCAVYFSDCTWNVSPRIKLGRETLSNYSVQAKMKQIVVPIGIWYKELQTVNFDKINNHTLIYAGGILPHQGIQLMIEAVPHIKKQIPDFKFIIIGVGSYENHLKKRVNELKLNSTIKFLGYIPKHSDVERKLSYSGASIALYSKEQDVWSYYADPSKIKSYLNASLPVITTSLTHIAKDIEKNKCGIVVDYTIDSLITAVTTLMTNEKKHQKYRMNAKKYARNYDWDIIFKNALMRL